MIDKIEEKDMTKQHLEKFRSQASKLIEEKKIYKYFEVSALTGEGVENLIRHLEIDASMISEGNFNLLEDASIFYEGNIIVQEPSNFKSPKLNKYIKY